MKYINISNNKKYKKTEVSQWAKEMLKGLKNDYKAYQKQCRHRPGIDNVGEYMEGLIVGNYIKWFIHNHFEE